MSKAPDKTNLSPKVVAVCAAGWAPFTFPWRNYVAEFGLGEDEIGDLLRVVTTDDDAALQALGDSSATHARRALGELGAIEVIAPLLEWTRVDDGVVLDLPVIAALVGPRCLPALLGAISDYSEIDKTLITVVVEALVLTLQWSQGVGGDEVRLALCRRLEAYPRHPPFINGALLAGLELIGNAPCQALLSEIRPHNVEAVTFRALPRSRDEAVAP